MDLRSFSFSLFVPSFPFRSATICFLLSTSNRTFVFGIACTMSHEFGSAKLFCVCVYVRRNRRKNWLRTACPDDLFIIALERRRKHEINFTRCIKDSTSFCFILFVLLFPSYFANFVFIINAYNHNRMIEFKRNKMFSYVIFQHTGIKWIYENWT